MLAAFGEAGLRGWGAFFAALALAPLPAVGQPSGVAPGQERRTCEVRTDRIREVTPQGDLVLESGGPAKLSGLRLAEDEAWRKAAVAWLRVQAGKPVVIEGRSDRDRWSRLTVAARLAEPSTPLDLGEGLVAAGLAMADPSAGAPLCRSDLLAAEEKARRLSLGLWKDDRYKPIHAEHMDRLRTRIGSFVLVEGRIRSIGERSQRIYLNFGEHWAEDFTIVIPRRTWILMRGRGLDAAALRGRRIRARGILEPWQGAALTLVIPEMIERLAGEGLPR
ncbi:MULTISPECIES: thermonuclease family protein [Microvirga]|uniref:thermonuclease family protein n=1 Tax=Microvirga TaxID=186650 RepID=UPI001CFE53D4|nr:DNA-binding protein [Microvirga lenta]MCB5174430.1 DNA-binding protein [Microvirga lenta]